MSQNISQSQLDQIASHILRDWAGTKARTNMPPLYEGPGQEDTPGSQFIRSRSYKDWQARFPGGGPSGPGTFHADPVQIPGGIRTLITAADSSAGSLVPEQHVGLLDPGMVRPLTIRDLITVTSVESDTVEYARETARIAAAAPVSEATALTGVSRQARKAVSPSSW